MKCAKCGKRLRSNEKFCTYCGYYNDTNSKDNWTPLDTEDDLLEENWYEDDIEIDEDEEITEPTKKTKTKKETKKKEEKPKKEEKVKKEKPVKEVKEIKIKENNEVYDENEKYIESYIGEDYKLIKRSPFNIWAFLLNWMYLLYRKLYITGIIGLIITLLVAIFYTKYFLTYFIITIVLLGLLFNPYYVFIVKRRVKKILVDYEGSDPFSLQKICSELGGVNVVLALIIYLIFLVFIVFSIVKISINKTSNVKFWKENSENKANCTSLVKLVYNQEKTNYNKVEEALCKVNKSENTEYEIYLKVNKNNKTIYAYYETEKDYIVFKNNTEKLDELSSKKTLTGEENKILNEIKTIPLNYNSIYKKSNEEDELIKKKQDKKEKVNFIFNYEEIIR